MDKLIYSHMVNFDFSEVEKALWESLGEKTKVLDVKSMGGGCIHHATVIHTNRGEYFLKWNDSGATDAFLREAEGLRALESVGQDQLQIPTVYAVKEIGHSPGFLVLEYFPPGQSGKEKDERLGRGLALIHQSHATKFGFAKNNYCGATPQDNQWRDSWPAFYRDQRLDYLIRQIDRQRPLTDDNRHVLNQLLLKIEDLIPGNNMPSLIHGDLWSGNYIYSTNGVVLIDPAAYYADREMEFSILTMFGGFSETFFNAYNEVFPLASDWEERLDLYQLYHFLNHYLLFGGHYLGQALSMARKYI